MKIILVFVGSILILIGCTPYGSPKDTVNPLKEYQEYLSNDYQNRTKNLEMPVEKESLIDVHKQWWYKQVQTKKQEEKVSYLNLGDLYKKALLHSNQIRVFSDIPIIRETGIMEAKGDFDPVIFAEGGYNRINRQTKSVLETGTANRLKENELYLEFGVRKKFAPGTRVELKEKLQRIQNNSDFFDPGVQSLATLKLSIIQPFLKGAGIEYNESVIRLAELDTEIAKSEFKRQMESHLLEITRAYWTFYLARVNLMLKEKGQKNIQSISEEMKRRGQLDALQSQIYHTEANLSLYDSSIVRLKADVKNARDRLVSMINAPEFKDEDIDKFVPLDIPYTNWTNVNLNKSIETALYNRPEIEQAYLQIRAATVKLNMSKNELLPVLDGILEFGLSGLRADNDMSGAISDQFTEGNLGVSAGFRFESPLPNKTAKARHLRRQVEKRQLLEQFQTIADGVLFQVQTSVREVQTAYKEFVAEQQAFIAIKKELEAIKKRRVLETILSGKQGTSHFLQLLLQTQNRYLDTEFRVVKSMIDYNLALTSLKRSEGTFLAFEKVRQIKEEDKNGLPLWRTVLDQSSTSQSIEKNIRIFNDNDERLKYNNKNYEVKQREKSNKNQEETKNVK